MDLLPGYTTSIETKIVCKLPQALYRLKQSPLAWFGQLSLAIRKYGFKQSNSNHTLFMKHKLDKVTVLIVYVDDVIQKMMKKKYQDYRMSWPPNLR